jgi:aryl-alcohol dehydrogenase-like predicted oxidoreductase
MRYTMLGRSELRVSALALGTMTFGAGEGFAGLRPAVDDQLARRMVALAVERGVTLFDSAARYQDGEAEQLLGRALEPYRHRVAVSTKDPVRADAGPARAQVVASVEASLRRLGIDVIDLYQVGVARLDQDVEELAEALDDVVRRGLVREVGVTNLPSWQLERVAATAEREAYAPVVAAQMSYSLLERTVEIEYRGLLENRGIGVLAWSPLAGGFLAGKYTRDDPGGHGGRLQTFHLQPLDRERGFVVLDVLREIAAGHAVTPAAVALAWAAAKPFVSSAVFGATTIEGLAANLDAADLDLSPEEVAALDDVSAPPATYPYWLYSPR